MHNKSLLQLAINNRLRHGGRLDHAYNMAACCLIGTRPGEVKAFWYDTAKNEWKNFAPDQRNSQVQVVKETNILYLRVIPDDKSKVPVFCCRTWCLVCSLPPSFAAHRSTSSRFITAL